MVVFPALSSPVFGNLIQTYLLHVLEVLYSVFHSNRLHGTASMGWLDLSVADFSIPDPGYLIQGQKDAGSRIRIRE
jgi:hypothetical protein